MKKLSIYCIVDVVSETILNVFSAVSFEMAVRQFKQALEANKEKIYDIESVKLFVPCEETKDDLNKCGSGSFIYFVPESYDDVLDFFDSVDFHILYDEETKQPTFDFSVSK